MLSRSLFAPAALALLLAGCSLTPPLELPPAPVAGDWPSGPAYQPVAATAPDEPRLADLGWRGFFRAPELQDVIGRALENNRDLRVAALRVEQARAAYRVSRADRYPTLDAGGSFTRQRTGQDFTSSGRAEVSSDYRANLATTAFELDFFGRVRSLNEQALEQYLATEEARHSAQIALIAEVAEAYLTLLADRELLTLTEATLEAHQESYGLTATLFDQGLATSLDVAQARTAVETARANRALYTRRVAQARNALELLAGEPLPGDFGLGAPTVVTADFVAELSPGLPSDLLLRRPDLRQAEHSLRAANASIGAARAAFWPSITLTASGGLASGALSSLFQAGSGVWAFAPAIDLPIFDAGRREANLESSRVEREIALAQYEQAIQVAFREVADALAARGTLDEQIAAQASLVEATRASYDLSVLRFRQGLDAYLATLDSQRELYAAQQALISLELERLSNLVTLYKALGGGVGETDTAVAQARAGLSDPSAPAGTAPAPASR